MLMFIIPGKLSVKELGLVSFRPIFLSFRFLVSASSSRFTLVVHMREVSCVGYTSRAWDLRSCNPY